MHLLTTAAIRSGWRASLLSACCALLLVSCGGGGGGGVTTGPTASFLGSGSSAAPNLVRLRAGTVTGDRIVVDVVLGGPTTSNDIYSFAFEIALGDPTVVEYVSNSAVAGTALQPSGGQSVSAQAAYSNDRLIVGVTKLGVGPGNGSSAAEATVVRLTFRVLRTGSSTLTLDGTVSASNPIGRPLALDSTGAILTEIQFDIPRSGVSGTILGS